MMGNLSKTILQTQPIVIVWNQKQKNNFFRRRSSIQGNEIA